MYRYAVAGAGLQGTSVAYDLGLYGDAQEILLLDRNRDMAEKSAARVNTLLQRNMARGLGMDIRNTSALIELLISADTQTLVSAMHYGLNEAMTIVAIRTGLNMCDLGGSTEVVRRQHKHHAEAQAKNITIVPDCGMGPGLNISLGMYAMSLLDDPQELYIWDGGLPQNPQGPWQYAMTFNIHGLINEYTGDAFFLRDSKVVRVPTLTELETLEFPGTLGRLEATVTSGGLSTAPWTLEGRITRLENKTLRYPGHWAKMKVFEELGLFRKDLLRVGDAFVAPREVFHALFGPQIARPEVCDVGVMRVRCIGKHHHRRAEIAVELVDYYDSVTGFTAMQRLTGWHASAVAILCTTGRLPRGIVSVETIAGDHIVAEMKKRGIQISERLTFLD